MHQGQIKISFLQVIVTLHSFFLRQKDNKKMKQVEPPYLLSTAPCTYFKARKTALSLSGRRLAVRYGTQYEIRHGQFPLCVKDHNATQVKEGWSVRKGRGLLTS